MKTSEKILDYIKIRGQVSGSELVDHIGITDRGIRKQLKTMLESKKITKIGKPPKVFYSMAQSDIALPADYSVINSQTKNIIDNEFMYITPLGSKLMGWDGFTSWCNERKMDAQKTAASYIKTLKKYSHYKKNKLIDGMYKMKSSFDDVALDKIFYLDFYSIEIFGKTKLGQLLLFAKQSQDRKMINEIADGIKPVIEKIIKDYNISAVGFIPPTVKRELQLMKQIQNRLNLNIKVINLTKIKTAVIVPQKTLNKIGDRVANAKTTIAVDDSGLYDNILLVDDAVGSGATLNETAKKLRERNMCKGKIIGVAIVGSFKGFEIISEI